jgi:hypothetical protein
MWRVRCGEMVKRAERMGVSRDRVGCGVEVLWWVSWYAAMWMMVQVKDIPP